MFQLCQEIQTMTTSGRVRVPRDASGFQDYQDRAYHVASSMGHDLSLDEPLLGLPDLWLLNSTLMVENVH